MNCSAQGPDFTVGSISPSSRRYRQSAKVAVSTELAVFPIQVIEKALPEVIMHMCSVRVSNIARTTHLLDFSIATLLGATLCLSVGDGAYGAASSGTNVAADASAMADPVVPDLTAKQLKKIEQKKRVIVREERFKDKDGKDQARGMAIAIIRKPWTDVWDILTNYDKQPEYMPRLTKCRVDKKDGNTWYVFHKLKVLFVGIEYTLKMTLNREKRRIHWEVAKDLPHDIAETIGSWEFFPHGPQGKHTLVAYRIFLDSGRMIPQSVQNMLTKKDLPGVLRSLRRRVETGGKWQKD